MNGIKGNLFTLMTLCVALSLAVPPNIYASPPDVAAATILLGEQQSNRPSDQLSSQSHERAPAQLELSLREALINNPIIEVVCRDANDPVFLVVQKIISSDPTLKGRIQVNFPAQEKIKDEVKKTWRQKFKSFAGQATRAVFHPLKQGVSIAASVVSATGFSMAYWLVSKDVEMTAKMFTLALVVNGFQVIYSDLWRKYYRMGGEVFQKATRTINTLLGRVITEGSLSEAAGRAMAIYLYNFGVINLIFHIRDAADGALIAACLALAGSWDAIWDLYMENLIHGGHLGEHHHATLVRTRLVFGPPVEAVAYSGAAFAAPAAAIMGVIGISGAALFFHSSIKKKQSANPKRSIAQERSCADILDDQN